MHSVYICVCVRVCVSLPPCMCPCCVGGFGGLIITVLLGISFFNVAARSSDFVFVFSSVCVHISPEKCVCVSVYMIEKGKLQAWDQHPALI